MFIDNISQDIEIEMINDGDINKSVFSCYLKGPLVGLPVQEGDILTIKNTNDVYNLVGIKGKQIEIDPGSLCIPGQILFHYTRR
jgi:hypothetical protein